MKKILQRIWAKVKELFWRPINFVETIRTLRYVQSELETIGEELADVYQTSHEYRKAPFIKRYEDREAKMKLYEGMLTRKAKNLIEHCSRLALLYGEYMTPEAIQTLAKVQEKVKQLVPQDRW